MENINKLIELMWIASKKTDIVGKYIFDYVSEVGI